MNESTTLFTIFCLSVVVIGIGIGSLILELNGIKTPDWFGVAAGGIIGIMATMLRGPVQRNCHTFNGEEQKK